MRPRCWVDTAAQTELWRQARRFRVRETGGALLGWRDGQDAVVACVLGPGPRARHRPCSFEPDGAWQAAEGARIYTASARTIAYIGDWHTHPRGGPIPSRHDREAADLIARDPAFRAPNPLSAIIGRDGHSPRSQLSLAVFVWIDDRFEAMHVTPCEL